MQENIENTSKSEKKQNSILERVEKFSRILSTIILKDENPSDIVENLKQQRASNNTK